MYKFSSIVGKIIGSNPSLSQGLKPGSAEAAKIIYSPGVKFPKVSSAFVKPSKSGLGEVPEVMLEKYKRFQVDDGVPIHLKGGTTDRVLYYTTLIMCAIGMEECFRFYYDSSFPKKE